MAGDTFQAVYTQFAESYMARFHHVSTEVTPRYHGSGTRLRVIADELRGDGNYPNLIHHGEPTRDVIVLIHGLTDSPYYVEAIGHRFFDAGANVVFPLLPGHGLKDPSEAMADTHLDQKWKAEVDAAVEVARQLGSRVSIGGFSTGGALSVNHVLRHPEGITGGIFLFAAALSIGSLPEFVRAIPFAQALIRRRQGEYKGIGPNPYKYPVFSNFGALELADIISETSTLLRERRLLPPVFAAHSVHDEAAQLDGITEFMQSYVKRSTAFVMAENPPLQHASTVLDQDIELQPIEGEDLGPIPQANPQFDAMMSAALEFYARYITSTSESTSRA